MRLFDCILADASVGLQLRFPFRIYAGVQEHRDGRAYKADPNEHQLQTI